MEKFSKEMYPIYVHGPRNSDELNTVTSLYSASGFPGCVGSTDCVHVRWEMCPSMWTSVFKNGKHSYCTIAYEMTVDHSKRLMATTRGHYDTTSDKTIVKFDGFIRKVKHDDFYVSVEFKLQVDENKWIIERGLYLLVDGGYHKWRIMQCPYKFCCEIEKTRWSELAESMRKDVECSFGILKKRYQFLKTGITWHYKSDSDNVVFSCVILHNMSHEFDGYDKRWEAEIENTHNDEEEQVCLDKIRRRVLRTVTNNADYSYSDMLNSHFNNISFANEMEEVVQFEISTEHETLRNKLINHLNYQYLAG